jgi:parvulin-like peptidyl-prolyl isomerase
MEELHRSAAALAGDRGEPLEATEVRRVLDRLIDEELLLQRALELGLVRDDPRARGELVSALIDAVVSDATAEPPTPAEVEAFYREKRDYFARPGRVRVEEIRVRAEPSRSTEEALARAREAAGRLRAGEPFSTVEQELGDPSVPLPEDLLPPKKLLDYLGPTATRTALDLEAGEVSDPVRSVAGFHVLRVLEREPLRNPPFEEIEEEVRAELRRRRGDEALRAYVEDLRDLADVRIAPELR